MFALHCLKGVKGSGEERGGEEGIQMASIERIEEGDGVITVFFNSPYEVELDSGIQVELPQLRKGLTCRI